MLEQISVALLEDDSSSRAWLERGIGSDASLRLVASFAALAPATRWFTHHDVDVLLTDLALPDGHALALIRDVAARVRTDGTPRTDVLVISMFGDDETVFECIEAGAVGYLHKDSSPTDIAQVVLDARRGSSPISPMIARRLLARFRAISETRTSGTASTPLDPARSNFGLTPAETEVLSLIARGHTYAEIGRVRGVSISTVQSQIKVLYGKLAVHSRSEAVYTASRLGLIDPLRQQ
jgi:DNA-binding NarL/FixJ family response regulator